MQPTIRPGGSWEEVYLKGLSVEQKLVKCDSDLLKHIPTNFHIRDHFLNNLILIIN